MRMPVKMTAKQISEYFAAMGRRGMRERWKGTTKAERKKATEAATAARLAKRNGKGGK